MGTKIVDVDCQSPSDRHETCFAQWLNHRDSQMHTVSSYISRLLSTFTIALLLTSNSASGFGQLKSTTASIALIARLESLSVAATLPDNVGFPAPGHNAVSEIPVLLTTGWAVPSNRTTVRVVEDGKTLFSQGSGDSNRPKRRIDQLNIAVPCDELEAATREIKQRRVTIVVQAL